MRQVNKGEQESFQLFEDCENNTEILKVFSRKNTTLFLSFIGEREGESGGFANECHGLVCTSNCY